MGISWVVEGKAAFRARDWAVAGAEAPLNLSWRFLCMGFQQN